LTEENTGEADLRAEPAATGAGGSLLEKDVERFGAKRQCFRSPTPKGEADLRAEPAATGAGGSLLEKDVERFGAKRQF